MKKIGAAAFKQHCLAILDRVDPEGVVITKHGRPVARLVPANTEPASLIGALEGKLRIKGDIVSTGLDWDAES
jgi:prevent-host-death family protein